MMRVLDPIFITRGLALLLLTFSALATQQAHGQAIDYATKIQPIYNTHCITCHSEASPEADMNLATNSYANTVNVSANVFSSYRVRPNLANNTQSAVFNVLVTQGSGLNHRGNTWVATAQQKTDLTNWIKQGALPDLSPPTVTSVSAATGPSAGGTVVTITGTRFGGVESFVPVVTFGGVAATAVAVGTVGNTSFTKITCTTPPHAPGQVDVIVTTTAGGASAPLVNGFTYGASTNNNLAGLVPSYGSLSPSFSSVEQSYTLNVPYAVGSIRFTPTTADSLATVQVNGVSTASTTASNPVNLVEGANAIPILVTAENNSTKTYTVTVTRAPALTSATLSQLLPSTGTLSPAFNFATTAYMLTVPLETASFTLTPTLSASGATLTIDGQPATSGAASQLLPLNSSRVTVSLVVTAADTTTTQTYTVTVQRNFIGAPRIVMQPVPRLVEPGGAVTFNVEAVGSATLGYQWRKNGVNIAAATGRSYTMASAQVANAGTYSVVVTNSLGFITSDGALLTVVKAGVTGFPQITTQPQSALVALGTTATFSTVATGNATLLYQWRKAAVAQTGATATGFTTLPTTLISAGTYSVLVKNADGSVVSAGARLGVVGTAASTKLFKAGTTATLTVVAAGEGLIYQWKKNGVDMVDNTTGAHIVTGTRAASLVIKGSTTADTATYTCLVRMGAIFRESGAFSLKIYDQAPIIQLAINAVLPPGIVSGSYHDGTGDPYAVPVDTSSDRAVVTFSSPNLPAGLKIDPVTGVIYGKPTVASKVTLAFPAGEPFKVTLIATNGVTNHSVVVLMHISPLPVAAVGTFNGLVDRDASLSSGLSLNTAKTFSAGGTLNVTTSVPGIFSGNLVLGTLSYPFSAKVLDAEIGANPTATVVIARKLPLTNLTLAFSIDKTTGELTGTVTDGVAPTVNVQAWCNTLQPLALQGAYTAVLDFTPLQAPDPTGDVAYPQGNGFGTLTVTTKGATWSGRLADGTVATYATTIGGTGQVPLHLMLYTNTGSVHGWMQVTADNVLTPTNAGQPLLDGAVDWVKIAQAATSTNQNYKSGFALHKLTIAGGKYVKGTPLLGIADTGVGTTNAKLTFSEGGLTGPPPIVGASMATALNTTAFRLTSTNTLVMPAAVDNPATLKFVSFSATTGAFTGTCVLKNDPDPTDLVAPITQLSRTVSFAGLLVPRVGINQGVGYFLLSKLPELGSPNTTLRTSPILSGQIVLGAK